MSIAPRLAKCTMRCTRCAGQSTLMQWWFASPSRRTSGCPHSGHCVGNFHLRRAASCAWRRPGPTTSGMTSPALRTITVSPGRTSLRATSSSLCSVARPDGGAADEHRLELRERRGPPGAADAHHDVAEHRRLLLRRELVRDRPARRLAREPELVALREIVDLHHRAVDLVAERVAVRDHALAEVVHGVDRRRAPRCGR